MQSVKMLSQRSFVQGFSDMGGTLLVPSSLLVCPEETKIPVKSLSQEPLSHSFDDQSSSVFLALFEVADTSPAP